MRCFLSTLVILACMLVMFGTGYGWCWRHDARIIRRQNAVIRAIKTERVNSLPLPEPTTAPLASN